MLTLLPDPLFISFVLIKFRAYLTRKEKADFKSWSVCRQVWSMRIYIADYNIKYKKYRANKIFLKELYRVI